MLGIALLSAMNVTNNTMTFTHKCDIIIVFVRSSSLFVLCLSILLSSNCSMARPMTLLQCTSYSGRLDDETVAKKTILRNTTGLGLGFAKLLTGG